MGCRVRFGAVVAMVAVAVAGCGTGDGADRDGQGATPELSDAVIAPEWCERLPRDGYSALRSVEIDSDWFEAWEVGEGVIALYEPRQWQEVISYLVLGSERAVLFDSGMGIASIADVVGELTELPVTVVNSHSHIDHVGGNAEFESVLGMDTDYTRTRAEGLPNEAVRGELAPEALCGALPDGVTRDGYVSRPWTITETVSDGHEIDLGGRTLEILHIPGHTPDAVALLDAEAGYLWTGDSFYEGPIWLFAPETDLDAYEVSVGRLAGLADGLTRVFPAHNTPVASPERLGELRDVFARIRAGTLEGQVEDEGVVRFEAGAFSLLLRPGG